MSSLALDKRSVRIWPARTLAKKSPAMISLSWTVSRHLSQYQLEPIFIGNALRRKVAAAVKLETFRVKVSDPRRVYYTGLPITVYVPMQEIMLRRLVHCYLSNRSNILGRCHFSSGLRIFYGSTILMQGSEQKPLLNRLDKSVDALCFLDSSHLIGGWRCTRRLVSFFDQASVRDSLKRGGSRLDLRVPSQVFLA
jgi:hypothetical protein